MFNNLFTSNVPSARQTVSVRENKASLRRYAGVETIHQFKKQHPEMVDMPADSIYSTLAQWRSIDHNVTAQAIKAQALQQSKIANFQEKRSASVLQRNFGSKASKIARYIKTNRVYHVTDLSYAGIHDALALFKGRKILLDYSKTNLSVELNVPHDPEFRGWWEHLALHRLSIESGVLITDEHPGGNMYIVPEFKGNRTEVKKIAQSFRDGTIDHCMLTPIFEWANGKLNECIEEKKAIRTRQRYTNIVAKIKEYLVEFAAGVPEDDIPRICNELTIDISVVLPFATMPFIEHKSIAKKLKAFHFINTRIDHVQMNNVVCDSIHTVVTQDELTQMQKDLDSNNEYYTFQRGFKHISSITTLRGKFAISNEFTEACMLFEKDTGLDKCKIDFIADENLSQFVREGVNQCGCVDFRDLSEIDGFPNVVKELISELKEEDRTLFHIDMTKAYTAHSQCKFYEGFLGNITDFRQCNHIVGVGLYRVTDFVFPYGKMQQMNDVMRMYIDNNVYTSAELRMLTTHGVTYRVLCGCWGTTPIKFEFPEEWLTAKQDDIPYYSRWVGVCHSEARDKTFWLKGSQKYFDNLTDNLPEGTFHQFFGIEGGKGVGMGCFKQPKKAAYHLSHIAAFVTSYQRMNLLEQLMVIDQDHMIRVCTDGIYHTQPIIELKNVFCSKEKMTLQNKANKDGLMSNVRERTELDLVNDPTAPFRAHFANELHLGCGGSGKTHMNMTDTGFVRPLFVAPSWKLARNKQLELGVRATVWARITSTDPEKTNYISQTSNCLIIDEVSMMSDEERLLILKNFPGMKIIWCGDIGFQLPCITGKPFPVDQADNVVVHPNNYRCTDPKLLAFLEEMRTMIASKCDKSTINRFVMNRMMSLKRVISMDTLKKMYDVHDMILSGTNEIKDYYTNTFAGKFDEEKYYVIENNSRYSNGEIIIGVVPDKTKCEVRHCFTTHSIQGETAQHKLFIDSSRMFDPRMYYTAISRARTLDQVYIVVNDLPKFKYEGGKIYEITNKAGDRYIGSTVGTLDARFDQHKKDRENHKVGRAKNCTSFLVLEGENAKIKLIETYKCNDMKDLWAREAELIKASICVNKTHKEEAPLDKSQMFTSPVVCMFDDE